MATPSDKAPSRPLVLLVDDDEGSRESTAEYVEFAGFRVVAVGTASDALAAAEAETPDAAILDLNLPDSTGEELGRALKRQSKTAHVPLIVVSGRAVRDEGGLKAEVFAAVLRKPAHPALIVREIRRYLPERVELTPSEEEDAGRHAPLFGAL